MGLKDFRALAKILSTLKEGRFDKAIIMRACYRMSRLETVRSGQLHMLEDKHGLILVSCRAEDRELLVTLLLGRGQRVNSGIITDKGWDAGKTDPGEKIHISVAEISEFVQAVGDNNELHQGEQPVIPGLLMMEKLLSMQIPKGDELEMRFRRASYAGEIQIDWNRQELRQQGDVVASFAWC